MRQKLTIPDFQKMIRRALTDVTARAGEFSELDAVIGDGDHGEAIVTALNAIARVAGADDAAGKDFKVLLADMGFGVMLETSGSTSTLLGGLLLGMSDGVPAGLSALDAAQVKAMFRGGLEGVQKNTKAMPGDKTMMDALYPAVTAMQECASDDIVAVLKAGAEAAQKGAEATVQMKANFGRARNYGEKSVGHADSGASSWACMFGAFAAAVGE
ncbi:DAK2 domain-containing protein [uncultured Rikenella sp.]|uniref:DAK2 domain-containing protein n=1 Tax=uncultured Rikenella sp. TaxID=368003 RepID=UPI002729B5AB|nr:DAK2 domain-containing protein [uncultured Rikenella sp.]